MFVSRARSFCLDLRWWRRPSPKEEDVLIVVDLAENDVLDLERCAEAFAKRAGGGNPGE